MIITGRFSLAGIAIKVKAVVVIPNAGNKVTKIEMIKLCANSFGVKPCLKSPKNFCHIFLNNSILNNFQSTPTFKNKSCGIEITFNNELKFIIESNFVKCQL